MTSERERALVEETKRRMETLTGAQYDGSVAEIDAADAAAKVDVILAAVDLTHPRTAPREPDRASERERLREALDAARLTIFGCSDGLRPMLTTEPEHEDIINAVLAGEEHTAIAARLVRLRSLSGGAR